MAQNPWSLAPQKQLAQAGMQALASGKVSPQQAAKNARLMGLEIGVDPESANDPFSMAAPSELYGGIGLGNQKGARAESKRSAELKRTNTVKRDLLKSADQSRYEKLASQGIYPKQLGQDEAGNPTYDFENLPEADPNDPYQEQKRGIDRTRELLAIQAKSDTSWLQPLAALADARAAETGRKSDLSSGFEAPAASQARFMKSADDIQKRQGDLSKEALANQKLLKGGSTTDSLIQMLAASSMAGQSNVAADRQSLANDRMDYMAHQRTVQALRNDKGLRDRMTQYQNLRNAADAVGKAEHISAQQFDELQQAVRANLGIKGNSGVSERERTQLNSLDIAMNRLKQIAGGNIEDIPKDHPMLRHIQNLASIEMNNSRNQYEKRLQGVMAGNASVYKRRPDLKADLDDMVSSLAEQVPAVVEEKPAAPAAAPAATGLPSMDAIDAELKKRGGV